MIVKKKVGQMLKEAEARPMPASKLPRNRPYDPKETTDKVAAALSKLRDANAIVIGTVPSSDRSKPDYKILLGSNNAIWCECNGFKYRSKCSHMDRFRSEVKPTRLGHK
jgi:hypothetical protein